MLRVHFGFFTLLAKWLVRFPRIRSLLFLVSSSSFLFVMDAENDNNLFDVRKRDTFTYPIQTIPFSTAQEKAGNLLRKSPPKSGK